MAAMISRVAQRMIVELRTTLSIIWRVAKRAKKRAIE